jgi:hypothetical protein
VVLFTAARLRLRVRAGQAQNCSGAGAVPGRKHFLHVYRQNSINVRSTQNVFLVQQKSPANERGFFDLASYFAASLSSNLNQLVRWLF